MRMTKYAIAQFTFYDKTGIQNYLEKQAQKGWMLEKIGTFAWKFRRIEPKEVHFAVTYFSKASVYDPEPTEQQKTFQEFCAHSGWKLAGINGPLQIFYNESEAPVPIETDARLEVQTIHASAKKNFLPSYILLLAVALMQLTLQINQLINMPIYYLTQNTTLFNWFCIIVLMILCAQEIGGYFLWYRRARTAAEESGELVETKGRRNFQLAMVGLLFIGLILLICSLEPKISAVLLTCMAGSFGLLFAVLGIKALMKRKKASRSTNMVVTIGACVVLSVVLVGGLCYGMVNMIQRDMGDNEENVVTYTYMGQTHTLYRDEIPLTIQELLPEVNPEIYSYRRYNSGESLLLGQYDASQHPRYDMLDQPRLEYRVVEVKAGFLYRVCLNTLLETDEHSYTTDIYGNVTYDEYRIVDPAPWGAEEAYQEWNADYAKSNYLLCYETRIVELDLDWEPTVEQMAIIGEAFGDNRGE